MTDRQADDRDSDESLGDAERQAAVFTHTRRARRKELAEDYVELIDDLIEATGEARLVEIARRMGVTHMTASKAVARLQRDGLVTTRPYRSIFLTGKGRQMALRSRRRHQIVLDFLKTIGVSDETARRDAEGIEHHVSEETLRAFTRLSEGDHAASPPRAERRPRRIVQHGQERIDPYAWLRAGNWQEAMRDPSLLPDDIRRHLEAENAYTQAVMEPLRGLQERLRQEMRSRIKEDDTTAPAPDGPFSYYTRFVAGGEHPLFCREDRDGEETVLLDGNLLAEGRPYCRIAACTHSPDHRLIAYTVDLSGSEDYTLAFRDARSGAELEDRVEQTAGRVVWANDSRTVFYTLRDDNARPRWVYRLNLGGEPELVYEEADPGFFLDVEKTESGRFILLDSHDHTSGEIRLVDADRPGSPPRLVAARRPDVEYSLSDREDCLLILTNDREAEDFRIAAAPLEAPDPAAWEDLVPHRPGRLILQQLLFQDWIVRLEREDGLPRIIVRAAASGEEHAVAFEEEAYSLSILAGFEYATDSLRFAYASPTTPRHVYDYDMARRTRRLLRKQEVPSGHDPADYRTRRVTAVAPDGESVPVTLLYRADLDFSPPPPCLLYGYGAYGISIPAGFSTSRLSLVDRGFVYAIAHIRGGTDRGYRWYRTGKLTGKTNSFDDFIAAGRHLMAEGYAGGIVAHGGSAGGLLVGAAANRAPELFRAVLAEVPFVDVLNTMSDPTLPLTPPEWPEWGNPIEDEEAFRRIAAYSPYENAAAAPYPDIFATAGVSDPRVTYWEPAKWIAALREAAEDDPVLLLRINMTAGHGGASGRFEALNELAELYAFALSRFGISD